MTQTGFNWKEVVLAILLVASGVGNAYFWHQVIFGKSYSAASVFYLPILSLFIFAVFFSLTALFVRNIPIGYGALAAALLGSFFFVEARPAVLLILVVVLLGAFWAYHRIRSEEAVMFQFRLAKILRQGLPLFFTVFALFISLFYFINITEDGGGVSLVPKSVFDFSLDILQNSLGSVGPGFRADATMDEFLLTLLTIQSGEKADLSKISQSERQILLGPLRSGLAQSFGLEFTGKEKAADILYTLVNQKTEELLGGYRLYLPYLAAFGLFLTIKLFTFPLYLITLLLNYAIVALLLAAGILKREKVSMEVERITF